MEFVNRMYMVNHTAPCDQKEQLLIKVLFMII